MTIACKRMAGRGAAVIMTSWLVMSDGVDVDNQRATGRRQASFGVGGSTISTCIIGNIFSLTWRHRYEKRYGTVRNFNRNFVPYRTFAKISYRTVRMPCQLAMQSLCGVTTSWNADVPLRALAAHLCYVVTFHQLPIKYHNYTLFLGGRTSLKAASSWTWKRILVE